MAVQSNTPMIVPRKSQEALVEYYRQCCSLTSEQYNMRNQFRNIDLSYMREKDWTVAHRRAKVANAYGDSSKFQNVTVPVVMPQVEAAVTYQSSVFLTGNPIFGVVSNAANMDAAMQMETVIDEQAIRGGWVRELMMHFRNGFKYNLAALEINWDRYVTAALETDINFAGGQEGKPVEVMWAGNCLKNLDVYNTFFDTRVNPAEMYYRGEFAGYTELMSRIELKGFIASLPDKMVDNIVPAFESGLGSAGTGAGEAGSYFFPQLNPDAIIHKELRGTTNWLAWVGMSGAKREIQYKDVYEVTRLYCRILPSDFSLRLPSANTPQIFKLIIINHQVPIYIERQTNAHGYLPILFSQPLEDGLGYQTKSLASNVESIQDLTSALWNSNIAARRRAISDRVLYDPSRVAEHHINSDSPTARIPVRPAAYGKPIQEAVYPFPFRDDQSQFNVQESQQLLQMANQISGKNQAQQGQFVKGNKTLHEFQTVMANANGRDQMVAMALESQLFTPLKEMIKYNILQYQGGTSLYNRAVQQVVQIDPVQLRKAVLDFKISDGLLPSDKIISADALQTALQVLGSSPQIAQGYNIAPLFSYLIKSQGGHISEFEKSQGQVAYEQAMAAWQQQVAGLQGLMQNAMKGMEPQAAMQMMQQAMQMMPPQPQPQQYGYNPQQVGASAVTSQPETIQATRINNITNNIVPASATSMTGA